MKKVTGKHFYPFAIDTFIKAFNEEEVMQAKFTALGAKDISISIQPKDSGFTVEIQRKIPAEVPGPMKAFLGDWNTVIQKETWTGSPESGYQCAMTVEIEDVPVAITGTMKVTANSIMTTNEVEMQMSSDVPLFGSQVEGFVSGSIEKSMADEFEFIKSHLG